MVNAVIMKPETPLHHGRTVAGASNASARLQRTTGITECIRQILALESDPDLSQTDRILTAVENCGLNAPSSSPVCCCFLSVNAARGVVVCSTAYKFCKLP